MKTSTKLTSISAAVALSLFAATTYAQSQTTVEMFKNPYCGCCEQWAAHLRKSGFKVNIHVVPDVTPVRRGFGMADQFVSCHTAKIGGYVVEGHVPAQDIQRLLKEKPKALGIASPGMPPSAPGMDGPVNTPYEVLLVQADGSSRTYVRH
jgi:hypothetical protein